MSNTPETEKPSVAGHHKSLWASLRELHEFIKSHASLQTVGAVALILLATGSGGASGGYWYASYFGPERWRDQKRELEVSLAKAQASLIEAQDTTSELRHQLTTLDAASKQATQEFAKASDQIRSLSSRNAELEAANQDDASLVASARKNENSCMAVQKDRDSISLKIGQVEQARIAAVSELDSVRSGLTSKVDGCTAQLREAKVALDRATAPSTPLHPFKNIGQEVTIVGGQARAFLDGAVSIAAEDIDKDGSWACISTDATPTCKKYKVNNLIDLGVGGYLARIVKVTGSIYTSLDLRSVVIQVVKP